MIVVKGRDTKNGTKQYTLFDVKNETQYSKHIAEYSTRNEMR